MNRDNVCMARMATSVALAFATLASTHAAVAGTFIYGYPLATRCPAAGIAKSVDRFGMYACNCMSYAAWALAANRQRTDRFTPGSMDARNWPNVARRSHITVGNIPRVGAIAVWPKLAPPFGHVAYVSRVNPGGTFDVAEYNFEPDNPANGLHSTNEQAFRATAPSSYMSVDANREPYRSPRRASAAATATRRPLHRRHRLPGDIVWERLLADERLLRRTGRRRGRGAPGGGRIAHRGKLAS
jgi:surface antigen